MSKHPRSNPESRRYATIICTRESLRASHRLEHSALLVIKALKFNYAAAKVRP